MSDYTQTTNLRLFKPTYDADAEQWGNHLNSNSDTLDALFAPSGSGGAPWLPLSGGHVTGALNVTATGGSVVRSVQDRFADTINVKDFGAIGNGTTDDTSAIQAAVNAVPAGGATVTFPKGDYLISNTITLTSNTWIDGRGATMTAAPHASWPYGAVIQGFLGVGVSNVTVSGMSFVWPRGTANYGSGNPDTNTAPHIISFRGGSSHIQVLNCTADGGQNMTAIINCMDVLTLGCRATNQSNSSFDHWGGCTDVRIIGCYAALITTETNSGMAAIQFTAINTDGTAAPAKGFICTDNIVYVSNNSAQCININGHPSTSTGTDTQFIVANNKIFVGGTNTWGILASGYGSNGVIHDNYLEGSATYSAVAVQASMTNVQVRGNVAVNWQATAANGVFQNVVAGGTLINNVAYGSGSYLIAGTPNPTALLVGNDTGATGVYTIGADVSSLTTVALRSVNTGTATGTDLSFYNGGSLQGFIGNYSAFAGGAYDSRFTMAGYAGVLLMTNNAIRFAIDNIGVATFGLDSMNTNTIALRSATGASAGGNAINFYQGGTLQNFIGSYSAYFGGAYDGRLALCGFAGTVMATNNAARFTIDSGGNAVFGAQAAGAVGDTGNHLMIPFCNGAPTGVPTGAGRGVALRYDTSTNKLWAYNGAWRGVVVT